MSFIYYKFKYGPIFCFRRHLFDIKLYSLKQYNDFFDKKFVKFLGWLGLITMHTDSPIGIELWLSSPKDFNEEELERIHSKTLKYLGIQCRLHLFKKAKCFGSKTGTFLGILVTHEDYYYILMDEYGNKWYESCASKLEFIKE